MWILIPVLIVLIFGTVWYIESRKRMKEPDVAPVEPPIASVSLVSDHDITPPCEDSTEACSLSYSGIKVWTDKPFPYMSVVFYTDQNLTIPFLGGGKFYGISFNSNNVRRRYSCSVGDDGRVVTFYPFNTCPGNNGVGNHPGGSL